MPLEALSYDVTPAGLHYLLIHYDIPVVDPADWRLSVTGRVARELSLSIDDLRERPAVTLAVTMECAGNGRAQLSPRPLSQPWLLEAVGTAEWTGTPLRGLLDEAGVGDDAVEVAFRGLDRGLEGGEEQLFERSLPLDAALGEDVLLAYAMNGQPLPPQHGFPLRLVVPGWYGMTSVKWLERISLLDRPFEGYQQARGYRVRQAPDEQGEPVSRMQPRSLIVPPGIPDFATRARTLAPGPCTVRGRAWSGFGSVERVEVSSDGGADLVGRAAWPARLEVGVAGLGVGLGAARRRRVRALLAGHRQRGQRPAARSALEPRRLRQQRGAPGGGHRRRVALASLSSAGGASRSRAAHSGSPLPA